MNPIDYLIGKTFDTWEGEFECYDCYQKVKYAQYDPTKDVLTWECTNKHLTLLEHPNV